MLLVQKLPSSAFALVLLLSGSAPGTNPGPAVQRPLCRLEVQNAHISTTLLTHSGIRVVKVNVSSVCNVEQAHVLITLEIHKRGKFGDDVYGPFINDQSPKNSSGLVVKLQNKYVVCSNSKITKWFGVAYSKALIAGKWQYAGRTDSLTIEALPCGT